MADERHIVVEVPSERGYSPVASTSELSRLEEFKKGWRNAIVLVTGFLRLEEFVVFARTYHAYFDESTNSWRIDSPDYCQVEEFMPALPLPEDEYDYQRGYTQTLNPVEPADLQPGEFWEDCYLYYPYRPGQCQWEDNNDPSDYEVEDEHEYNAD